MVAPLYPQLLEKRLYEYAEHSLFLNPDKVYVYLTGRGRIRVSYWDYVRIPEHIAISVHCTSKAFRAIVFPEIMSLIKYTGNRIIDIQVNGPEFPFDARTKHYFSLRCAHPEDLIYWKDVPKGKIKEWVYPDLDDEY